MNNMNRCKCGSNRIFQCRDTSHQIYRYWCQCGDCGYVGGMIFSRTKSVSKLILKDGTEITGKTPAENSMDIWNQEMIYYKKGRDYYGQNI